ncbi:MAG: hypothetical protein ABI321_14875 [Polyangia bacterium]
MQRRHLAPLVLVLAFGGQSLADPNELQRETTRMLDLAAGHATESSACVDGSGTLTTVAAVTVALGPRTRGDGHRVVHARYAVTVTAEGDTRGCPKLQNCLPPPVTKSHSVDLELIPTDKGFLLEVPPSLPGLQLLTPMNEVHASRCYGSFPAWTGHPIRALP